METGKRGSGGGEEVWMTWIDKRRGRRERERERERTEGMAVTLKKAEGRETRTETGEKGCPSSRYISETT